MHIIDLKNKLQLLYQRSDTITSHNELGDALGLKGRGSNIRIWIAGNDPRPAECVPDKHIGQLCRLFKVPVSCLETPDFEAFRQQVNAIHHDVVCDEANSPMAAWMSFQTMMGNYFTRAFTPLRKRPYMMLSSALFGLGTAISVINDPGITIEREVIQQGEYNIVGIEGNLTITLPRSGAALIAPIADDDHPQDAMPSRQE